MHDGDALLRRPVADIPWVITCELREEGGIVPTTPVVKSDV